MTKTLRKTLAFVLAAACVMALLPMAALADQMETLQHGDIVLKYQPSAVEEAQRNATVVYELYVNGKKEASVEAQYGPEERPVAQLTGMEGYSLQRSAYGRDSAGENNPVIAPDQDGKYELAPAQGEKRYFSLFLEKEQQDGGTPKTFTVTFDGNGATTAATPSDLKVTEPATKLTALPKDPEREGHIFKGWNTKADGTGSAFTLETEVKADITVYAQWESQTKPGATYTVTFDGNKASVEPDPKTMTVTEPATKLTALPTQPSRIGYRFMGWNTKLDGTGQEFTLDTEVKENMTVYAQWEQKGGNDDEDEDLYLVRFDSNGGSRVASQRIAYGSKVEEPDDPQREGYTFVAWYKDEALKKEWDFDTDKVRASTTLYAKWEKDDDKEIYTIKVTTEGNGTASKTGTFEAEEGKDLKVVFQPKAGYGVKSVKVDGKYVAASSSYTFRHIQQNHTLHVVFARTSEISAPATGGAGTTWIGLGFILVAAAAGAYVIIRKQRQK